MTEAPEPVKRLPLTNDVIGELELLSKAAWGKLNGKKFTKEDVVRAAYLTSELLFFARYGREDMCPSVLSHGPGHQSRCRCELPPDNGHEIHQGDVMGETAQWRGLTAFTGYFNELPDVDDE